jgi:hypothetical protein
VIVAVKLIDGVQPRRGGRVTLLERSIGGNIIAAFDPVDSGASIILRCRLSRARRRCRLKPSWSSRRLPRAVVQLP